jgi:hypothetical protein
MSHDYAARPRTPEPGVAPPANFLRGHRNHLTSVVEHMTFRQKVTGSVPNPALTKLAVVGILATSGGFPGKKDLS